MWIIVNELIFHRGSCLRLKYQMSVIRLYSDKAILCYLEPLVTDEYKLTCAADDRLKEMTNQVIEE